VAARYYCEYTFRRTIDVALIRIWFRDPSHDPQGRPEENGTSHTTTAQVLVGDTDASVQPDSGGLLSTRSSAGAQDLL
jgi:hypothetical protein